MSNNIAENPLRVVDFDLEQEKEKNKLIYDQLKEKNAFRLAIADRILTFAKWVCYLIAGTYSLDIINLF